MKKTKTTKRRPPSAPDEEHDYTLRLVRAWAYQAFGGGEETECDVDGDESMRLAVSGSTALVVREATSRSDGRVTLMARGPTHSGWRRYRITIERAT